ncbi:MAG: ATP-binding protein [Gammaproteobacteria bacterium]|nr:ATP-binding protein [Gammaproteobacteria bacterium]
MKRKITTELQRWLHSPRRKPLIIRGARQVGKTWLVRHLADIENKQLVELNFEREPRLISLFASNDPVQVLKNIAQHLGISLVTGQVLLFLDEIQRFPELLAKLRWFAEEMPELAVIAAGSLLDFALEEHTFSMPVGRVSYLYIEPLSFEEFLLALHQEALVGFLEQYRIGDVIPDIIHHQLLDYVREYTFVGGLPAAVEQWSMQQDLSLIHEIQHELVTTYQGDFAKYRNRLTLERLEDIWYAVPKMLGKQWKYSLVNSDVQAISLKQALHLLTLARICHPVHACAGDGMPLAAGVHNKVFKVLFLDIGLASNALGLVLKPRLGEKFSLINEGGLAEQFIGQGLRLMFPTYVDPSLYYWSRERQGSAAEVDYLIQHEHRLIPVEVKAGKTGQMRSLHVLMALREWSFAVRFNADFPSLTPLNLKTALGADAKYELLSLPFYLVNQLSRFLAV